MYNVYRACAEGATSGVSGNSLEEVGIQPKRLFSLQVLCSWPIATKVALHVWYWRRVLRMDFQEDASNGRPDTTDKALRSSYKEPFTLDRVQPSLVSLWSMHGECKFWRFRKSPRMEAEIQPKRYFVLQVNCPWLLTDHNRTDNLCRAILEITKCGVLGKFLKRKPRYSREGTLFSKESGLCYWPIWTKPKYIALQVECPW
jgi:hypothetical protein